jgi:general transcription factor 3C polypeptide 5 (transcription factor C subunit 1)
MYNYEGNPNAPALDSKRDSAGAVAFLRFKDECEAPSNPTPVALSQMTIDQDSELLEKVKALFAARPVWQRNSLEEALSLGSIPAWRLAEVLRQVSYLFLDGPWRKCYVRFGFDPRKESSARVLQMIDFRDPFFKTEQGARSQTSGPGDRSLDIHFRSAPSNRSQLYQLCDIEDPAIQAVVNAQGSKSEPDPHTGWLTETEIDSIRNQMKIKSESMRRAALHSFQGDRK